MSEYSSEFEERVDLLGECYIDVLTILDKDSGFLEYFEKNHLKNLAGNPKISDFVKDLDVFGAVLLNSMVVFFQKGCSNEPLFVTLMTLVDDNRIKTGLVKLALFHFNIRVEKDPKLKEYRTDLKNKRLRDDAIRAFLKTYAKLKPIVFNQKEFFPHWRTVSPYTEEQDIIMFKAMENAVESIETKKTHLRVDDCVLMSNAIMECLVPYMEKLESIGLDTTDISQIIMCYCKWEKRGTR